MAVVRSRFVFNKVLRNIHCDEIIAVYGQPDVVEARSGEYYSWLVSEEPLFRLESSVLIDGLETEFKYYYYYHQREDIIEQFIKPLYKNKTAAELLELLSCKNNSA